ncbi:hypothetical protein C8R43DRAFT_1238219 [Mycena crocata]|nr:hypothetical protein C8R43DRAFT_1238219 [Mycena crocata]
MPAIAARDSSQSSSPNITLILAIVIGAMVLIVVFVALTIPIIRQRRAARNQPAPSNLEQFMSKAEREKVFDASYSRHHHSESSDSTGPLLEDPSDWAPAGRQLRIQPSDLPSLPDNAGDSYDGGHKTGPITHSREPPPGLRVSIPQSAPIPASKWVSELRKPSPSSPVSSDSESMYSERSASTTRMHTVDLSSPPPPVPALPQHLRLSLPPEEPPLARGNTVVVATLLKSRAQRLAKAPERSLTRTSRIERADSITEAPSPEEERRRTRPPPLPMHSLSVDANGSFADTLEYYTSQPLESPSSHSPGSVSSYDTVRPARSAY